MTSQKQGASALGLQRNLGLGSYTTAWGWLHKLRRAMVGPGRDRLNGEVEVDETFVGGLSEGMRGRSREGRQLYLDAPEGAPVLAGAMLSVVLVALLACLIPAWRAMRIDPMRVLRHP